MIRAAAGRYVATWGEHVQVAGVVAALIGTIAAALVIDRRPPFEYVSTQITPTQAVAGQSIVVHRHVVWHRQCEGFAFTEIVNEADHIVTIYDRGVRYPAELGDTQAERSIALPLTMRPGLATYRGVIRFSSCGITSRWRPIEVPYQEVRFEVR